MSKLTSKAISVSLLGVVTVQERGKKPVALGLAGTTLELLSYLFSHAGRPIRRDLLADMIWENLDESRSRATMNTALWRVRKLAEKIPGVTVRSDPVVVQLDLGNNIVMDTQNLRHVMRMAMQSFTRDIGLPAEIRIELDALLQNQTGEFLECLNSAWVLAERQDYLNMRIRGYAMLMQDAGLHLKYEDALQYGRRILALDPFQESVHCQMLWLFTMTGRRASAIKHYREYKGLLHKEFGVEPMAEMQAIYDMVCSEDAGRGLDTRTSIQSEMLLSKKSDCGLRLAEINDTRRSFYCSHFAIGV